MNNRIKCEVYILTTVTTLAARTERTSRRGCESLQKWKLQFNLLLQCQLWPQFCRFFSISTFSQRKIVEITKKRQNNAKFMANKQFKNNFIVTDL